MYKLKEKEMIFIYTGPDGSGRKTLAKMVATAFDMQTVPSFTTRSPRPFENNGEDYHFVSKETFQQMKQQNEFLESVEIDGHFYGLREVDIVNLFKKHKIVYLTLNPEGAEVLKKMYGEKAIRVFVYADRETVYQRQKQRGDEESVIEQHMKHYDDTLDYKKECEHVYENYDLPQVSFQISEMIETYLDRQLVSDDY
ncbi:guanylate kinase [Ferdinandcohnia quinoae]|uniref:Guanylate kinase n=1 Tax=Fredinandcohnia quinoae TaxID=2918902 RepID=A0AAW5EBX2_9BACI|nr:guanylate kinase [Fredinandcohnia sp. SECRCQ15]MCH1626673.1 guanylate kinase [Fredinandcohnia sp. SECRCQ15]